MTPPYERVADSHSDQRAWLNARCYGIGASEIASVLGISPFKSALELWHEKVSGEREDLSDREPIQWGHLLEPVIIQEFARRTGRSVLHGGELLRSTEHTWAIATLDAWTWDPQGDEKQPWPLEVKAVGARQEQAWEDGAPEYYVAQVQQQMLVTGCHRATIAALIGGQRMVWEDIERDPEWVNRIVYNGERFWQRVLGQDPPPPDGSFSARRALLAMYQSDDGSDVMLSAQMADHTDAIEEAKRQKDMAERVIAALENELRAALGPATRGILSDGRVWTYKEQQRRGYTVQPSTTRVLRLAQPKGERR